MRELLVKKIEAAEFKEQFPALLDDLDEDGLIITDRGVPVARVTPCDTQSADLFGSPDGDLIGSLRDKIRVKGNVFTTGCYWKAESRDK